MKYQKPAYQIEAYQVTPFMRDTFEHWPRWLKEAWKDDTILPVISGPGIMYVVNSEGQLRIAEELDWIVYDYSDYEVYSDADFELIYEPVPEVTTQGLPEALEATQWAVDVVNKEYTRDGKFYMAKGWGAKLKAAANWVTLAIKLSKI